EQAQRVPPDAAGQPSASEDWHLTTRIETDATAIEHEGCIARIAADAACRASSRAAGPAASSGGRPVVHPAEGEGSEVLEEEIPLLWKEQAEARQIHLLFVGFHLREVGIDGRVCRKALRHTVLGIEASVRARV